MTDAERAAFLEQLRAQVGKASQPESARDPVNQPMIRHWCDAMEDQNPVYTDAPFAAQSIHRTLVAPPAMLHAWMMPGNISRQVRQRGKSVLSRLNAAGYTSVVATNSEQEYLRYLKPGDVLTGVESLTGVSEEKHTTLGAGHFVTMRTEYRDQTGAAVGHMQLRLLKFKPGTGRSANAEGAEAAKGPRPVRPRPGISRDTQFFWDGFKVGELRIQRCNTCRTLHHPPMVRCPACGGYDFGYQVSSGKGTVYSFVEPCHPKVPAFDYPYVVGLVELEEGTRLITNIVDLDPERVAIGMRVEVVFQKPDPDLILPMFRPQRPPRRQTTLSFDAVAVGDELPPCPIPVTTRLIVAGAIASRDYQDVHHDREAAVERGLPDIFMNIFTTGGLCGRYLSDWAGPEALMRSLTMRLGVPNFPHDTMTLAGAVRSKSVHDGRGLIEVGLRGYNRRGDHVTGTAGLELPRQGEAVR